MSRKTRRNALKHAGTIARGPAGLSPYTKIGLSGLTLGSMALSGPLLAQQAQQPSNDASSSSDQLQEVVVTGIRASLQKSLDIKRDAIGVVDAVSAEDIGNFPESNLGAAAQRIPGVTVDRTGPSVGGQTGGNVANGNSGAAVSIGQPTSITVRGFGSDFNDTLVDGRPMASAIGRGFDYSSVGADFVSEIAIHKTPDFSLSAGDVGATINIKFPKPFDHPGLQLRGNAAMTDYANDGQFTPQFGILFSDTFFNDTVGVLIDGDYTHYRDVEHHLDIVGWKGTNLNCSQFATAPAGCGSPSSVATIPSWYAQDYALYVDRTDDRRKDGRAVIQWHPNDALMVTLDDNYSDDRMLTYRDEFSLWYNSGSLTNVTQDKNGTITNFLYGPAPTDFDADWDGTYIQNNEFGLNVLWNVNDQWTAELDADQSASHLNPGGQLGNFDADVGYGSSTGGIHNYTGGIAVPGGNNLPYITSFGPTDAGGTANVLGTNPYILGSHVFPITAPYASDYINQAKVDVTWKPTADTKVNVGLQFVEDTRNSYNLSDFVNNGWQLWSGYGPASNPPPAKLGGQALPSSLFTGAVSTKDFLPGWSNNGQLPSALLAYDPYAVYRYLLGLGAAGANPGTISGNDINGVPFPQYAGGPIPLPLDPNAVSFVQEKTYSPFFTVQQKFDLGGMALTAIAGMRYERTDVTTAGYQRLPTSLTVQANDPTAFNIGFTNPIYTTATNSYNYFLPSLDLNLLVLPDLKVRFDASRTLTRPPLNEIIPTLQNIGGRVRALSAQSGNSSLLPYLSNNFDLGAEWYYGRNDYLAIDGFFKHVSQFPVTVTNNIAINGVTDPTAGGQIAQWSVSSYLNGPSANVDGIELGWQQMLVFGFGVQINGTYVHTNKPYDQTALTNVFALPGIADSANFVGFYQAYGFQARVAVNWQDKQLLYFGQEQNGGAFGTEPTFADAHTEVDFSSSYDINSHFSVFFEALNLNDSQLVTHGRFSNQTLNVIDYGRSFTMGVRARL